MGEVTSARVFVRVAGGVLIFRVVLGIIFALTLIGSPEGHMLILFDLPAMLVFWVGDALFGVPEAISNAFAADYLICATIGWTVLASFLGAVAASIARIR